MNKISVTMKWELNRIHEAFKNMEKGGWDTKSSLKWGFTFLGETEEKLLKVFSELKDFNYCLEKLEFRDDLKLWILYVTKIEKLELKKLHRRNLSFEELANYHNIDSYDGWDVEQIID